MALFLVLSLVPGGAAAQEAASPPMVVRTLAGAPHVLTTDGLLARLDHPVDPSAVIEDGVAYTLPRTVPASVDTLDLVTGRVGRVWIASDTPTTVPLDVEEGVLYVSDGSRVDAVDLRSRFARPLFEVPSRTTVRFAAVGDGHLLVSTDEAVIDIELDSGASRTLADTGGSPALVEVADGVAYVGLEAEVVAIDLDTREQHRVAGTGRVPDDFEGPAPEEGPATDVPLTVGGLTVADGALYIADGGRIAAVDLATGDLRKVAGIDRVTLPVRGMPVPSHQPQPARSVAIGPGALVVDGGLLYAATFCGLLAVDLQVETIVKVLRGAPHCPVSYLAQAASAAELLLPDGLRTDGTSLYVADFWAARTIAPLTDGMVSQDVVAGDPNRRVVDVESVDGDLFLADEGSAAVLRLDSATGSLSVAAGGGTQELDDGPRDPHDVVVRPTSLAAIGTDLYVAVQGARVFRLDVRGERISAVHGLPLATEHVDPYGAPLSQVTLTAEGSVLYAGDSWGTTVWALDTATGDVRVVTDQVHLPGAMAVRDGVLAVAAYIGAFRFVVLIDTATGALTPLVGPRDGSGTPYALPDGWLAADSHIDPRGLVWLPDGRLAFSDERGVKVVEVAAAVPDRVAGAERTGTAAALSALAFPGGADTAFVVSAGTFGDALVAGPAAASVDAPLLLTDRDLLSPATETELRRLTPDQIIVVGGTARVSDAVVADLEAIAPVERVAGNDMYATSVATAQRFLPESDTVYLATAADFPDGLAGGAAAARDGAPILLTDSTSLPDLVGDDLAAQDPETVVILGGPGTIRTTIDDTVQSLTGSGPQRRFGDGRYDTAADLATDVDDVNTVLVATGEQFPDALAAVPAAARLEAALLVVPPDRPHPLAAAHLRHWNPSTIHVLGGDQAVSETALIGLSGFIAR